MAEEEMVAATTIRHGEVTDKRAPEPVERVVEHETVKEGEVVDTSDLTDEEREQLIASGAIVPVEEYLKRPSSKTSDVQTAAVDATPPGQEAPEGEATPQELSDAANESYRAEEDAKRAVELDPKTRLDIATSDPREQRAKLEEAKREAADEAIKEFAGADEGSEEGDEYDDLDYRSLQALAKERDLAADGSADDIKDRLRKQDEEEGDE